MAADSSAPAALLEYEMSLWNSLKGEARRNFIARPDAYKNHLVYKHPDQNIRKGTELTVEADEIVLFFRDGQSRGTLGPGRHTLSSDNIPFLGMLVDYATGGNLYVTELYFVTTRELPGMKFGGPVGEIQDPASGLISTVTVFGEVSVKIIDPVQFVVGFTGLRKTSNDEIFAFFKQLFLRTIKDSIAELVVKQKWPLLDVASGAYTEEIAQEAIRRVAPNVTKYGLSVENVANFHIDMPPEDKARMKERALEKVRIDDAGGWNQYAMGAAAMKGAETGAGSGGSSGMDMMGMMMAQQMMQQMMQQQGRPQAPVTPPAPTAQPDPIAEARQKIAQLKTLLDEGLITQEDFDEKKKEILARI